MVTCHDGKKTEAGRLKFKEAPAWFCPALTPREMLQRGMHGGIYFNPKGGKPGVKYPRSKYPNGIPGVGVEEFPKEWFEGVPKALYLSRKYSTAHNMYKVKSGLDQAGWESSGWINEVDPRGWTQVCRFFFSPACSSFSACSSSSARSFLSAHSTPRLSAQWYFRFYAGRRLSGGEDERQMSRWSGVCGEKGRWKSNLIAKVLAAGVAHDDASVSPVVRQTLLHWAYELTEADLKAGSKRVKANGAAYVSRDALEAAGVLGGGKGGTKREAAAASSAAEAEAAEERKKRAQRRADGASGAEEKPAKRARAAPKSTTTPKRKRDAVEAAELSDYEKQRDARKERNHSKLVELGLA